MAQSDEEGQGQLARYVNELLIRMHQSQRELIQARYANSGEDWQLRASLQSDIISLYWTLRPYKNRARDAWEKTPIVETENGKLRGLDRIEEWDELEQVTQQTSGELSSDTEKETQPQVLPRKVLIKAATALAQVADRIGFNAKGNDQRPYSDWREDYEDGVYE